LHAISVLATPISACCTASNEAETPRTGPTSAPRASQRSIWGFSLRAVNVELIWSVKAVHAQMKISAANHPPGLCKDKRCKRKEKIGHQRGEFTDEIQMGMAL
jgi:hypothetical protein